MAGVGYLDAGRVRGVRRKLLPHHRAGLQWTASGYGARIPSVFMVEVLRLDGSYRWQRVYVTQYGNAGTAWVRRGSRRLVLPPDVTHRLADAVEVES